MSNYTVLLHDIDRGREQILTTRQRRLTPTVSTSCRTGRVFISSTFRDMQAERDHLVTVVFPELRELVEPLGLEVFDVDLRWGAPAKDANGETANSWQYCRQWIDRVEPFFICILGQRYGWVPEPGEMMKAEGRRMKLNCQRQQVKQRSITDLEVRHAVLNTKRKRRSCFYLCATDAKTAAAPATLVANLRQPTPTVARWRGLARNGREEVTSHDLGRRGL